MARYMGYADTFEYSGKVYKQGDNIPLSKELQAHHEQFGHRFENTPEPEPVAPTDVAAPVMAAAPADAPIVPKTP